MSENGKIIVGLQQNTLYKDSTLYIGALEVNSNIKEKYHFANGFMEIMVGSLNTYNYYNTDHLGNVRHVSRSPLAGSTSIIQVNNYYPFGGLLKEGEHHWDIQNRFYNGKEYDRMQGLNLYDYSARQYDPAVCQFTSMDPLCEKHYNISPYVYCAGNPVNSVDPIGCDTLDFRIGKNDYAEYVGRVTAEGEHVGRILDDSGNVLYLFNFACKGDADKFYTENDERLITDPDAFGGIQIVSAQMQSNYLREIPQGKGQVQDYYYALMESKSGKMDFVTSQKLLEKRCYLPLDGSRVAHNPFNFGNYLWGKAMKRLGISYHAAASAAHIQNYFNSDTAKGQLDSVDDQYSISLGYFNGNRIQAISNMMTNYKYAKKLFNLWGK